MLINKISHVALKVILKEINLLIQVSNTIDKNIESKVLKALENDTTSRLIAKMINS